MKNRKFLKYFFLILGLSFAGLGLWHWYEEATGDFSIRNISYDLKYNPEWDFPAPNPEQQALIDDILKQKFTWIGHGHQIFAFVSEDQRYVLKVFKFKRLKPSTLWHYLSYVPPFTGYYERREKLRLRRFDKLFEGYRVAYAFDQENCGLLYVHLNKTNDLNRYVSVSDRLGFTYTINLDEALFAIQERGRMSKAVLAELLNKGDVATAKVRIRQLFDLYLSEYEKGVVDRDRGILHNTGFVRDKAIRMDLGQLGRDDTLKDRKVFKKDLSKIASTRINDWLRTNYPQYQQEIEFDMEQRLSEIFAEPFSFKRAAKQV